MDHLTVSFLGRDTILRRRQTADFGRDEDCDICLDPDDLTLSRRSGRLSHGPRGWQLVNTSSKQTLHLVGEDGTVRPLPPTIPPAKAVAWPLDGETVTVQIFGERTVHAVALHLPPTAGPVPVWSGPLPAVTSERRAIVAALGEGYLRTWQAYDPRPRTYREAADMLGLPESKVADEIGRLRRALGRVGVLPDFTEPDPRRLVVEWLIALGRVSTADRLSPAAVAITPARRTTRVPTGLAVVPTTTTHPLHDEVIRIAETTARHVGPHLLDRLLKAYGEGWAETVGRDRRATLRDYRLCLALLAYDEATRGWASSSCRDDARRLNGLANAAAHRNPLTGEQVQQARVLGARIREQFS